MKKIVVLTAGLVLGMFVLASYAASAREHVGVLNFQQIMKTSPSVKQASEKLRKQFMPEQNKIVAQQKSLQALMGKLKKNGSVMKASDRKALQAKIMKTRQTVVAATQSYQQKVMAAQQQAMQGIIGKIKAATAKVAKAKGLNLVVTNDAVVYEDGLDITSDVQSALK